MIMVGNTKAQLLILLAEIYGEKLTESRVNGYLLALKDLTIEDMKRAYDVLLKDPKQTRFPLPAQIRQAAGTGMSDQDEAAHRLGLILEAVRRFGYSNTAMAMGYLGVELWLDVERIGGWQNICCSGDFNLRDPAIYAQRRNEIKAHLSAKRAGVGESEHGTLESGTAQDPRLLDKPTSTA